MVSHAALFNRLQWMQAQFPLQAGEKVLHKTPISFDVSVWEIFWPLLNGGHIVLAEAQEHKNPQYLAKLIEQERIQYCHFVPSMLSVFLEQMPQANCSSLRRVFCSGEALSAKHSHDFYQHFKQCELFNLYGPTEAAIDVSFYHCQAQDNAIPIGRAISNTQLQLTNPLGQLAPMGAIAEISIGGANLAQAYWGNAEATAAAFISNPLQAYGHPSRLLYKTGDLGYFDAQQQLHFVGRRDRQVKIRGFRIELAEIEQCLKHLSCIKDAAVITVNGPDGNAQLAAYCVSTMQPFDSSELQRYVATLLPGYMMPSYFIDIDSLPQLSSGKIAYHLLPAPQAYRQKTGKYVAARNETEEKLQAIWQALLNIDKISVYDNFFELGGHSLLAAQALNQCQRTFNVQIKLSDVLQDPTIATAARIIEQSLAHKSIISDNNNSDDEEEITL
jgi:acyl-coenzyme A synthetase/AMP-(fatty) acid ligase/acyl carrier protein